TTVPSASTSKSSSLHSPEEEGDRGALKGPTSRVQVYDRVASCHSITSSARASSVGGTSMPSALAVLTLITSSNFVDRWIGGGPLACPRWGWGRRQPRAGDRSPV